MRLFFVLPVLTLLINVSVTAFSQSIQNPRGTTVAGRFNTPANYTRGKLDANSFGFYLRTLPLKPAGSKVLLYDGRVKPNDHVYEAVVNMEITNKDLQQCADAVMRLRAEYLFTTNQKDKIHFNFTNGFRADYSKWQDGYRIAIKGNTASWYKAAAPDTSHRVFRAYIDFVFNYAGTMSLSKELKPVSYADMQPGDVFIHGGSPGHAVIVIDMAVNKNGQKIYMLAQSYMPAQETQVLCNNNTPAISPWYELRAGDMVINTPEWRFDSSELKRFGE